MEHFKLVFGSGTSSPAKIRPLKVGPPGHYLGVIAFWELPSLIKKVEYMAQRRRGEEGRRRRLTTGVKQAVPYRTGREARYLSVSTE